MCSSSLGFLSILTGAIIGFSDMEYSTVESEPRVTVCTSIVPGTFTQDAVVAHVAEHITTGKRIALSN